MSPAELELIINERNRYQQLLGSLTHHFIFIEGSLGSVASEARSERADIQNGVGPMLSEFRAAPLAGSEFS